MSAVKITSHSKEQIKLAEDWRSPAFPSRPPHSKYRLPFLLKISHQLSTFLPSLLPILFEHSRSFDKPARVGWMTPPTNWTQTSRNLPLLSPGQGKSPI
ncbi:hypothetical protein BCR34DRAFT_206698 [Clohesyomyces aquaticus]|uniref:Uncharacterized protein n=1 Tax=Clohesyomyces aquaticus TaxID=1231657 RepID=A0A1Y2A9D7_9PLEO|nr:hypothetical protein BCR34DRAFT_206698 [Clohesyomyces aquaticus]